MDKNWFKYVNNLQEQGLIKIEFVRSETNALDIMTNNVSVELIKVHVEQLIRDTSYSKGNNPWSTEIIRERTRLKM